MFDIDERSKSQKVLDFVIMCVFVFSLLMFFYDVHQIRKSVDIITSSYSQEIQ